MKDLKNLQLINEMFEKASEYFAFELVYGLYKEADGKYTKQKIINIIFIRNLINYFGEIGIKLIESNIDTVAKLTSLRLSKYNSGIVEPKVLKNIIDSLNSIVSESIIEPVNDRVVYYGC